MHPGCREQGQDPAQYRSQRNKMVHLYKNQGSALEIESLQGLSGS